MSDEFHQWADRMRRLDRALAALRPVAESLDIDPPDREEWFELLRFKLLPQVESRPFLVVAIVGGTNIGKSAVFNHLAGFEASRSGPLASGTKHPVCLVPESFDDEAVLAELFSGFRLRRWNAAEDAIGEKDDDLLFWRAHKSVPERLMLLDTPDIDSSAEINWRRAEHVRQSADVLIAVLTEQKYNDAAVKRFFRKAAESDKPTLVLFNQCDLEQDAEYWPQWLETFCAETGISPELVYVAPRDRQAAAELKLPFYDVGTDARRPLGEPGSLQNELASLHFDQIKIRTFRGALERVLDEDAGAPAYLRRLQAASGRFLAAAEALSDTRFARVQWPTLPPAVLVDEIRDWWDLQRQPWSRKIHGVYRAVGKTITKPIRYAWQAISPADDDTLDRFQSRERDAVVHAVGNTLDQLERLSEVGNDILRERLEVVLRGNARVQLLQAVQASHAELPPVNDDFRAFVREELSRWSEQNPRAVSVLRSLDYVMAVARPAITVTLAVSGWIVAGGVVHDAALHAASEFATEAAITGGITSGGEAVVSGTSEGLRHAAGQLFRRLQARFAEDRAGWLANWLEHELLGALLHDLKQGAEVPSSPAFREVNDALMELRLEA